MGLLKWVGGKQRVAHQIIPFMGMEGCGTYIEPFFGGGGMFFSLREAGLIAADTAVHLADANPRLINFWRTVRDFPIALHDALEGLPHKVDVDSYNKVRSDFNLGAMDTPEAKVMQAARLMWLNRRCYGGVYRENQKGGFNVPMDHSHDRTTKILPGLQDILDAHKALATEPHAYILDKRYEDMLDWYYPLRGKGIRIYCDPPYMPKDSEFTRYTGDTQQWHFDDHKALATACKHKKNGLDTPNCRVIISNSNLPQLREMYQDLGYKVSIIETRRGLKWQGKTAEEIVAVY